MRVEPRLRERARESEGNPVDPRVLLSPGETPRLAYLTRGWAAHQAAVSLGPLSHQGRSGFPPSLFPLRAHLQEDVYALPFQSYPKAAVTSPRFGFSFAKEPDHGVRPKDDQIWPMQLQRNRRMTQVRRPATSRAFSIASWCRLRSGPTCWKPLHQIPVSLRYRSLTKVRRGELH